MMGERLQPSSGMPMEEAFAALDLSKLPQSLYAQGTEEAILERLLERIAPSNHYCVDIGASDGLRNSNTALLLRERGWQGALIEASSYRYEKLQSNFGTAAGVRLAHERVQPESVDRLLAGLDVPPRFDLLSIDIDGNDYWVWRGIERFRPRIVVIEYNPYYEPPQRWVMRYNPEHVWDGSSYYGASLESLHHLGRSKGYSLVCCDEMGNNAFFVEETLHASLGLADTCPLSVFRPAMYKLRYVGHNTFLTGHPYRYGPAESI